MACKSSCIDFLNKHIDTSRCVNCFNCIETCSEKSISYGLVRIKSSKPVDEPDASRRNFITGSLLLLAGGSQIVRAQDTIIVSKKRINGKGGQTVSSNTSRSTGIESFTARCTACAFCVLYVPYQCPAAIGERVW
jgi:ferredoxin